MSPLRGLAALFLTGALAAAPADKDAPRAWAATMLLPTWDEGPPDPLPPLAILGSPKAWYPYTLRTNFGAQQRLRPWRTLNLENQYLSCIVLPDLGGRLYTCRDKLTGYAMFHPNPSIKKANIGQRGAWAAAGMELNFPVSHSLTTVSPVDFRLTETPGSASVWVGATDRVTGMRWRVEFRLESGRAALLQNVRFENPTPSPQRYSWWSNAGVTLREDTRFVLPTRQVATHGLTRIENWPSGSDGIDRSDPSRYPTSLGLFAHGPAAPWFAVFHPNARLGTLHYADPAQVPGKKIWAWGSDEEREQRARLSDDGSLYVEMQAGLFENQETFGELPPGASREFTETWIPLRGLSGITQATPDAVLYAAPTGLELLVTRALPGATLSIAGAKETLSLDPARPLTRVLRAVPAASAIELRDAAGRLLLAYPPVAPATPAPAPPAAVSVSARDLVRQAALARWSGDRPAAARAVSRAAALDPTDPVARFEQLRQGTPDPELWTHLAADPERVLDLADAYLAWNLDRDAAVPLGHQYLPVPAERMEPGAPMPQDYALLVYYRGYVHQRLGQYAAEDFRLAATLPLRYVFPSRAGSRAVLDAALEANPADAAAHHLLGLWLLHAGQRDQGTRELQAANRLRPDLAEPRAALAALGLAPVTPPPPPAPTPAPAPARAPTPASATPAPAPIAPATPATPASPAPSPANLDALFAPACPDALRAAAAVTDEAGARAQYFAALVLSRCGNGKSATRLWERVSRLRPALDTRDYLYPQLALAALGRPFDAVSPYLNLRRALESATPATRPVLLYNQALLLALQGKMEEAAAISSDPDLQRIRLPR